MMQLSNVSVEFHKHYAQLVDMVILLVKFHALLIVSKVLFFFMSLF